MRSCTIIIHHAATSAITAAGITFCRWRILTVELFACTTSDAPYLVQAQTARCAGAIDELSIAVHAGEIVAVVGASGSGKTLLADAVLGLFEPNSTVTGRIWFDGERMDAEGLARAARARTVARAAKRRAIWTP